MVDFICYIVEMKSRVIKFLSSELDFTSYSGARWSGKPFL